MTLSRFSCAALAAVPRPRIPPGIKILQRTPEVSLHEKQRCDRPREDQTAGGPGRLCHQGTRGSVFPQEVPSNEEEVLRTRGVTKEHQVTCCHSMYLALF